MAGARDYGTAGPGPGAAPPDVTFADFSPTELYTLMESVAANVTSINLQTRQLEKSLRHFGSPRDTPAHREKANETQQNVNFLVSATTRDLKRLSNVVRRGDKRQKLQVEKLTQNFSESLNKYSTVQKQLTDKMHQHIPKMPMTEFPVENVGIEDDDTARLVNQQQQQARKLEFESGLLEEREAYIRGIEANVLDVNQIMQELSAFIESQGTVVGTIEENIEAASAHVESGNEELVKASRYQAKFRRKLFILIAIAVVVGIILTIIIVTSVKKR